jgi:hypothetical protein
MDRGTQIYSSILALICFGLAVIFLYEAPQISRLNGQLQANQLIKEFPFHFRVSNIQNGIATINSPVSTQLPCGKVIAVIFPEVSNKSLLSDEYQGAKNKLAEVQNLISQIVTANEAIKTIHWQLDKNWLIQNGISITNY